MDNGTLTSTDEYNLRQLSERDDKIRLLSNMLFEVCNLVEMQHELQDNTQLRKWYEKEALERARIAKLQNRDDNLLARKQLIVARREKRELQKRIDDLEQKLKAEEPKYPQYNPGDKVLVRWNGKNRDATILRIIPLKGIYPDDIKYSVRISMKRARIVGILPTRIVILGREDVIARR